MFILYALVIGLVVGTLTGGRPTGLATLTFRWSGVMLAGLLVQVVLFADPVAERVGALGPPLYVASTAVVLAAVLANRSIRGMPLVAIGATSNLVAILANGGYMPATRSAMEALGKVDPAIYSNSAVVDDPALAPLTDVFALPSWLPFANVFSIGDVLIGAGVVLVIALAMRSARPAATTPPTEPSPEGAPAST